MRHIFDVLLGPFQRARTARGLARARRRQDVAMRRAIRRFTSGH